MDERDYRWKFVLMFLLLIVWAWACYPLSGISQGIDLRGGAELEFTLKDPERPERTITTADLNATIEVLQRRIDLLGVKEVTLEPAPPAHFRVEYPGADPREVDDIIKTITKAGQLWFRIVQHRSPGVDLEPENRYLLETLSNDLAMRLVPTAADLAEVEEEMAEYDAKNEEIRERNAAKAEGEPKEEPHEYPRTIHWCRLPEEMAKRKSTGQSGPISSELTKPFKLICFNDRNRRINGKFLNTGDIRRTVQQGAPAVGFGFDGPRKRKFARMTEDNKGKAMAIVLDGIALSAPNIEERIFGAGVISGGGMDDKEVGRLIITLKSGALPAKPRLESKNFIGPALGRDAINRGFMAVYLGSALVVAFMIIYYWGSGFVAVIAIVMNLVFIVGSLALLDATLTLPGIAGIILTVGMAVDANILIFERIREERLRGKSVRQAMKSGYERAFWTIFDANLTTALTAFILFKVGTGPIRGFATTLLIGIIASMFTALFCTKAIFSWLLERKWVTQFKMVHLIKKPSVPFLKFRHVALVFSVILIAAGLFVFFRRGEDKYGIDFTGGTHFRLVFTEYQKRAEIDQRLRGKIPLPGIETVEVKSLHLSKGPEAEERHRKGEALGFVVRTRIQPNELLGRIDPAIKDKIDGEIWLEMINMKEKQLVEAERGMTTYTASDFTAGELITATALNLFRKDLALPGWPEPDEVIDSKNFGELLKYAKGRIILRVNLLKPATPVAQITEYYRMQLDEIENRKFAPVLVTDVSESALSQKDRERFVQLQIETKEKIELSEKHRSMTDYVHAIKRVFNVADSAFGSVSENMPESTNVAPRAAHNLRSKAFLALLLAGIAILIYITFRFEFRFALGAIAALVHDVLIAMGVITFIDGIGLVDIKISLPIIAAFLTIIGYSLNDTIVVFDRIRENMGKQAREKKLKNFAQFAELVNGSINETLSRTIWTSLTTFLVVLVLFLSGVQTIQGFAFTLIVGVVIGTYSSIFVAAPVLLMFQKKEAKAAEAAAAQPAKTAQAEEEVNGEKKRARKRKRRKRVPNNNKND